MSSRCGDAYMIIVSQVSAAESALAALLRRGDGHGHRGANSVYGAAPVAGRAVAAVAALGGPAWPVMVIVAHTAAAAGGASSADRVARRLPRRTGAGVSRGGASSRLRATPRERGW